MVWNSEQTGQQQLRHQSLISAPSIPNLEDKFFFNYIGFKNELSCTFSLVCVRAIDMLGTMKQQAMNQEKLPGFPKHFRLQRLHLQCIAMHSKTIYMYRKLKPTKSLQVPCWWAKRTAANLDKNKNKRLVGAKWKKIFSYGHLNHFSDDLNNVTFKQAMGSDHSSYHWTFHSLETMSVIMSLGDVPGSANICRYTAECRQPPSYFMFD